MEHTHGKTARDVGNDCAMMRARQSNVADVRDRHVQNRISLLSPNVNRLQLMHVSEASTE